MDAEWPTADSIQPSDRFQVAGVSIDSLRIPEIVSRVSQWIERGEKRYLVLVGAHGIVETERSAAIKRIYDKADLALPDGAPVVWIGRLLGHDLEQACAAELMPALFSAGLSRNFSHFFYGGDPGVADRLADVVRQTYPGIRIAGSYCPPFRRLTEEETDEVVNLIDKAAPDLVWVALGCPKQEEWISELRPKLVASVLVGVGAGFDFLSGHKRRAPLWARKAGLEWLYRAIFEGRRLRRRYLHVLPRILPIFIRAIAENRK